MTNTSIAVADPSSAAGPAGREGRLLDGLASLRRRGAAVIDGERVLFLLGAFLVPFGFLMVMVGWWGASGTGAVFEQLPFLISGGLGGLGLMVAGGFLYNAWWSTRQIREARTHHLELLERQDQLERTNAELAVAVQELARALNARRSRREPLRASG